jgi:uncharacterized membrane protein
MLFSRNSQGSTRSGGIGALLFASSAIAYPVLVYVGRDWIPLFVFVSGACLLLLLRAFLVPGGSAALFRLPLLIAAVAIGALGLIDAAAAAKAYPTVLSGLVAAVFANSLRHPPSLVERFARIQDPLLAPAGQSYCRKVTLVWAIWLSANALIAAGLAVWASIGLWTLWTGLMSYLIMGTLFLGEIVLRPRLIRRFASEPAV